MNKLKRFGLIVFLFASCAKPMISNLEDGNYKNGTAPTDIIDVSVSILPLVKQQVDPEKPKTFFDLRDSLPHIFLKVMGAKATSTTEIIKSLSAPLSKVDKEPDEKKPTDYTLYKLRFTFSNLKQYYRHEEYMHPNTRLEFLTTSLTIPNGSPINFYNIDKLENEFDEIDFGSLSRDQTVSLNAKLAVDGALGTSYSNSDNDNTTTSSSNQRDKGKSVYDADGNVVGTMNRTGTITSTNDNTNSKSFSADAKVGVNGEVGYLNSANIKEAVAVKLKRLRTGFNFSETKLMIAQRARPLGDISDNVYITTTLKVSNPKNVLSLTAYSVANLFDENNKANDASKIKFSDRNINFVPCDVSADIVLTTNFEGAVRRIENDGGTNALEYDDKVEFDRIQQTPGNTLNINKNLFCKNARKIIATTKDNTAYTLKIAAPVSTEVDMLEDDAPQYMLQWIYDVLEKEDATKLSSKTFRLYFEVPNKPRIYLVREKMEAADMTLLKDIIKIETQIRGL